MIATDFIRILYAGSSILFGADCEKYTVAVSNVGESDPLAGAVCPNLKEAAQWIIRDIKGDKKLPTVELSIVGFIFTTFLFICRL